jgi:hypothetical protein
MIHLRHADAFHLANSGRCGKLRTCGPGCKPRLAEYASNVTRLQTKRRINRPTGER